MFSSPPWGFFYLIYGASSATGDKGASFSSPLWGFFYLMAINKKLSVIEYRFSSPLWGFFYLIIKQLINAKEL